jgi:hypothetical protein
VSKNWPNDLRIDCKPFSNLVELIEFDGDMKEGIKKIERIFEKDEIFENIVYCKKIVKPFNHSLDKFLFYFQLFLNFFFNEYKFEIQIVKTTFF